MEEAAEVEAGEGDVLIDEPDRTVARAEQRQQRAAQSRFFFAGSDPERPYADRMAERSRILTPGEYAQQQAQREQEWSGEDDADIDWPPLAPDASEEEEEEDVEDMDM